LICIVTFLRILFILILLFILIFVFQLEVFDMDTFISAFTDMSVIDAVQSVVIGVLGIVGFFIRRRR